MCKWCLAPIRFSDVLGEKTWRDLAGSRTCLAPRGNHFSHAYRHQPLDLTDTVALERWLAS